MIVLRQNNFATPLEYLCGTGGFIGGAILGSKIPMKRKLKKRELKYEKDNIDECKRVIKHAKSGFTKKDETYDWGDSAYDVLSKYDSSDNPDHLKLSRKHLNKHKKEIIEECEKKIKQHEDVLKNPDKHKRDSAVPALVGGTLGAIGGTILGNKLSRN